LKESYADGTAGRTVKRAKQFFRSAVRARLLAENPFQEVKAPSQANESCKFHVTGDMAAAVLEACPDAEWRLIFSLCRFGGLRCPSELQALTWADIDWEKNRFLVLSPKL
jgi:integrase